MCDQITRRVCLLRGRRCLERSSPRTHALSAAAGNSMLHINVTVTQFRRQTVKSVKSLTKNSYFSKEWRAKRRACANKNWLPLEKNGGGRIKSDYFPRNTRPTHGGKNGRIFLPNSISVPPSEALIRWGTSPCTTSHPLPRLIRPR